MALFSGLLQGSLGLSLMQVAHRLISLIQPIRNFSMPLVKKVPLRRSRRINVLHDKRPSGSPKPRTYRRIARILPLAGFLQVTSARPFPHLYYEAPAAWLSAAQSPTPGPAYQPDQSGEQPPPVVRFL